MMMYFALKKGNKLGRAMFMLFVIMNMGSYSLFSAFLLTDMFFIIKSLDLYKKQEKIIHFGPVHVSNIQ